MRLCRPLSSFHPHFGVSSGELQPSQGPGFEAAKAYSGPAPPTSRSGPSSDISCKAAVATPGLAIQSPRNAAFTVSASLQLRTSIIVELESSGPTTPLQSRPRDSQEGACAGSDSFGALSLDLVRACSVPTPPRSQEPCLSSSNSPRPTQRGLSLTCLPTSPPLAAPRPTSRSLAQARVRQAHHRPAAATDPSSPSRSPLRSTRICRSPPASRLDFQVPSLRL